MQPSSTVHVPLDFARSYDGAEPTASSVAASNLARLAELLPGSQQRSTFQEQAEKTLVAFEVRAREHARAPSHVFERRSKLERGAEHGAADATRLCCCCCLQERLADLPLALPQMCASGALVLSQPLRQVRQEGVTWQSERKAAHRALTAALLCCVPLPQVVLASATAPDARALDAMLSAVHSAQHVPDKTVVLIRLVSLLLRDGVHTQIDHAGELPMPTCALRAAQTSGLERGRGVLGAGAPPGAGHGERALCPAPRCAARVRRACRNGRCTCGRQQNNRNAPHTSLSLCLSVPTAHE